MTRQWLIPVLTLAAGIAGGFTADRLLQAQQEPVRRTALLATVLEDEPGKDADVFIIDLAPGASTGNHSHPGSEIAYILEGTATVQVDGKTTPMTQRRGTVSYLKRNQLHNVTNASKSEPLKAVVFALYDKGKPKMTPAK